MKWLIHKHQLQPSTLLHLPRGAQVLTAQAQGEYIYLWEMHDPEEKGEERRAFVVYGTGQEFENPPEGYQLRFISTVQMLVQGKLGSVSFLQWHVFEVEKRGLEQ